MCQGQWWHRAGRVSRRPRHTPYWYTKSRMPHLGSPFLDPAARQAAAAALASPAAAAGSRKLLAVVNVHS